jgi:hypothetical protein
LPQFDPCQSTKEAQSPDFVVTVLNEFLRQEASDIPTWLKFQIVDFLADKAANN